MDSNPPFLATYKALFNSLPHPSDIDQTIATEEYELPVIDLNCLNGEPQEEQCKKDIMVAASEWGFFQVVNHGVSDIILDRLRKVQFDVFRQPFEKKASQKLLDFSPENYRWGTLKPTSLEQLSWSEAYHIPLVASTNITKASSRYLFYST